MKHSADNETRLGSRRSFKDYARLCEVAILAVVAPALFLGITAVGHLPI